MSSLQKEQEFFHFIARKVLEFVGGQTEEIAIAKHKKEADFATHVDVGTENIITKELKKRFPYDDILAEEGYSNTKITKKRIWIIDPICGTNNMARGIKNFCTNIALSDNKKLIASIVVDYSRSSYYWSVGENKVYEKDKPLGTIPKRHDVMIDVDFGAAMAVGDEIKKKHNLFTRKLNATTSYYLTSLNTSLGFAYVATGKLDGVLNVANNPWDVAASSFLVQQSGGIVTDIEGKPWTLSSKGAILAKDEKIHKMILKTFNS